MPQLVTHAGVVGLLVAVFALSLTFMLKPPSVLGFPWNLRVDDPMAATQLTLLTICGYGVVGAVDDRHSLSHLVKAAVPFTLGLPVAALVLLRFGETVPLITATPIAALGATAVLLVVPMYILVVSNLINMHSGFNGLQSGLSLILLSTILVRAAIEGRLESNGPLLLIAGSLAAFYPFNRYPARAIEGNVGSFLVGSAVGVGIVSNGWFIAGAVMLAPHMMDFVLFLLGKLSGREFVKFGRLRSDGTIESPYPYKLKFLLPYYFRLTERQAVIWLYALTLASCLVSFVVPW